ncbi:AraC family transcriptional regulator [Vallitalea okinawensis]|uniref:AraC family transcriptional regulator n=1 Tax=Vallitalea okinawensis TaxID=2078660 RepID=UPI000CFC1AEB|nr:AraC family transcriptional regulator [Vallitalea okinawensis]
MNDYCCVQKAIDYIEENIGEEISLHHVADEAYMSLMQLYREFYSLVGHSVKDYIRKRRISKAANRVKETDDALTSIALDSGFETQSGFIKAFKKITGVTPREYKKSALYFSFPKKDVIYETTLVNQQSIKVVNIPPMRVLAYEHLASKEDGIEEDAIKAFRAWTKKNGICMKKKSTLYGYNYQVDITQKKYGYRVMIEVDDNIQVTEEGIDVVNLEAGNYAVVEVLSPDETISSSSKAINNAWNQLYSNWLPTSSFILGNHQYFEEYIFKSNKLYKMRLFLPIARDLNPGKIEVVKLEEKEVLLFMGTGENAEEVATKSLVHYLKDNQLLRSNNRFYLSYDQDDKWWNCGIIVTKQMEVSNQTYKSIPTAYYACLKPHSYDNLKSLVDILYRWTFFNSHYEISGHWFAVYEVTDWIQLEEKTELTIYLPIEKKGWNKSACS